MRVAGVGIGSIVLPMGLYRFSIRRIAPKTLGSALVALKRTYETVEQYQQALAINPGYAEARSSLAKALGALRFDPNEGIVEGRRRLGHVSEQRGQKNQREEAKACRDKVGDLARVPRGCCGSRIENSWRTATYPSRG